MDRDKREALARGGGGGGPPRGGGGGGEGGGGRGGGGGGGGGGGTLVRWRRWRGNGRLPWTLLPEAGSRDLARIGG
ncbi:hypothetical protein Ga0100230_004810 [Opitutaceae bacterium TAV3]|nr:hypothetical protein Ga0100230_004810 [Opitutaceae bacterium TAV3]